jgi:hypothetical protein
LSKQNPRKTVPDTFVFQGRGLDLLDTGPLPLPSDWLEHVNGVETAGDLAALRQSARRGAPFGTAAWQQETARCLGLESTLKPLGRPRKRPTTTHPIASLFDTSSHLIDPP